ncbi:DUF2470 domain-containing protein [Micromonospora sp. HM5-17]|uniref:DUF2470 domain-containing protein n=1 Tax=Micromonospora sp. HM5-17 TaxID=2487710 RepID=UPI000F49179A|nr:DUF2470 domain-containing protein [Micromonospora sp. HM5-17]ROT31186.1 DUF2470 domain-containing protein [Micromonospora sp. HM5-17]
MQPSPAEVARTLAVGRLAGTAQVAYRPGPHQVRHATDPAGRVLLLVSIVSDLAAALRPRGGTSGVATVLDVRDLPPAAGAPSLGRLWISGWAEPLAGAEARQAAIDFAEVLPVGDLLDVGRQFTLYRFEPEQIRLERGGVLYDVEPAEYAAAEPDPLHPVERELLADLADHHGPEIAAFLRRQLGDVVPPPASPDEPKPRVVRLDRYGMTVAFGPRGHGLRARLAFPRPVSSPAELARLLHPVLCRGPACSAAVAPARGSRRAFGRG